MRRVQVYTHHTINKGEVMRLVTLLAVIASLLSLTGCAYRHEGKTEGHEVERVKYDPDGYERSQKYNRTWDEQGYGPRPSGGYYPHGSYNRYPSHYRNEGWESEGLDAGGRYIKITRINPRTGREEFKFISANPVERSRYGIQ